MHLLAIFEQPRPVLFLGLFFPQHELDVARAVYRLGVFDVDLAVELELDMIRRLLGVGFAGEGQARGVEVDFAVLGRDVRGRDGEVDDVLLRGRGVGALGPEHCDELLVNYLVKCGALGSVLE